MRRSLVVFFAAATMLAAQAAAATEVKVLTSGAFKQVVLAMVPAFERENGNKVVIDNDTAGALARRIEAGESLDLVVLTPALIEELSRKGRVAAGSATNLARVGVGVAVREGAPRPDIGSTDAFRRTLLEAKSVAYIDPAAGGSSGIYLARLFDRLGIADQIKTKAVLVPGGLAAERVARGEAEIGIHQISEILPVKGAVLVEPLPPEIQNYTVYTAGISAAAQQPAAAQALLTLLTSPETARVLEEKGMEPARK